MKNDKRYQAFADEICDRLAEVEDLLEETHQQLQKRIKNGSLKNKDKIYETAAAMAEKLRDTTAAEINKKFRAEFFSEKDEE